MSDEELPTEDTLPAIVEKTFDLPTSLDESTTLKQAKRVDVQVTNDMLTSCYYALGKATSISSLCRTIDSTLKVIEVRRKVLCLEYGHTDNGTRKSLVDPLED